MKIIIGKFGEDGEPIWFEVETNEWKDENGNWKDVSKGVKTRYNNVVPHYLIYTTLGRADLVRFESFMDDCIERGKKLMN